LLPFIFFSVKLRVLRGYIHLMLVLMVLLPQNTLFRQVIAISATIQHN